jgi:hypothetical protein
MTRRQITKRAVDQEHKRLMLKYKNATGGQKSTALKALQKYVTEQLKAA